MNGYRVFISYSRRDKAFASRLVDLLRGYDLDVLWDHNLTVGEKFSRQLQSYIAHSHVFIPIITPESSTRGWVHQEIGYALAVNVGILPVTVGAESVGIINDIHALSIPDENADLPSHIDRSQILRMAERPNPDRRSLFECGDERFGRARLIAECAQCVTDMNRSGMVRQHGALSSFAIPDAPPDDPVWVERHGHRKESSQLEAERLERQQLEIHARKAGCKLILRTSVDYGQKCGPQSKASRVTTLLEFLNGASHPETYAVIDPQTGDQPSQLIVGNWFIAESMTPDLHLGYRQTILTRHAHTVQRRANDFDSRFNRLLGAAGWSLNNCLDQTKQLLKSELG